MLLKFYRKLSKFTTFASEFLQHNVEVKFSCLKSRLQFYSFSCVIFSELKYISPEVIHDPTLPTTADHPCPKCESREAVFFQSYFRGGEEKMRMYYVCTKAECAHKWTQADLRT